MCSTHCFGRYKKQTRGMATLPSNAFRKTISRAFSYILDTPQQHPSLVAYARYALPVKYKYERPSLLELDEESTAASADHEIRPVMHPKRPLLMNAGYGEVINAGKTQHTNEDQSYYCSFVVTVPTHLRDDHWTKESCQIPVIYFAVFDGHAGTGAALCAYHRLHIHIKNHLTKISNMLVMPQEEIMRRYCTTGLITSIDAEKLIIGALEESFQVMDDEIKQERYDSRIDGGCTAVAAIFIKGKLYVAGAGDSRAVIYKNEKPTQLSRDHCPDSERKRIQTIACYKPSLLHDEYTRFQFQHRCRRKDVGTRQLYRDYQMDGWGFKVIDKHDMKPQLICGEGKRARLLDTIGTTRGFGDHDLEVSGTNGIKIKPFMSAIPEISVYNLQTDSFDCNDVLVMATDGLWEKLSNEKVGEILINKMNSQNPDEPRRYIVGAQSLVDEARGSLTERGWRMLNNEVATYDDISVFVIPIKEWFHALEQILEKHRNTLKNKRMDHDRHRILRSSTVDEYCEISDNPLELIGDQLTSAEVNDVTKSYDNIKSIELKGLEQKKVKTDENNGDGIVAREDSLPMCEGTELQETKAFL